MQDKIRQQITVWKKPQEPAVDEAQATFELLERAPILYMEQSDEEKARLLRTLVPNCWIRGEKLEPVYKKPLDLVAHGAKTGDWYAREDSNLRPSHPECDALIH